MTELKLEMIFSMELRSRIRGRTMITGWGVVGIGNHADKVFGPAINGSDNANFIAVCSRSIERAETFATKHGVKRVYDSYEKMLADPEVEIIYVATPNNLHAWYVIQAAEAGKHVLCEKPMATTEQDCVKMIAACRRHGVKLGIDFQNRYHPAHVEARRFVQNGTVGKILVARAQYCRGDMKGRWQGWRNDPTTGSGALASNGLHPVDLLRFILNSEITEVQAMCPIQTNYHQVDEMVYAILKFQNGVYGVVISGILAPRSDNDLVLYGSKAKVTCRGTVGMPLGGEMLVEGDTLKIQMSFPTADPILGNYIRVVEAFSRSVQNNTEPAISGDNGLQMVRIANAILESSKEGRAVKIEAR